MNLLAVMRLPVRDAYQEANTVYQRWKEKRRFKHLEGLAVKSRNEAEEQRQLLAPRIQKQMDEMEKKRAELEEMLKIELIQWKKGIEAAMRPLYTNSREWEDAAVRVTNELHEEAPEKPLDQLYNEAADRIGTSATFLKGYLIDHISQFERNGAEGLILQVCDPTLVPAYKQKRFFTPEFLELTGFSPEKGAERLTGALGMRISSDIFGKESLETKEETILEKNVVTEKAYKIEGEVAARVKPLERLLESAVNAYNTQIDAFRNGDKKAVYQLYDRASAAVGLEQEIYKDALKEHVSSTATQYLFRRMSGNLEATMEGHTPPTREALERFDRDLLPSYALFSEEVAEHYRQDEGSIKEIAEQLTEKYGMRISRSHVSRIALQYINKEQEEKGEEKIYSRKEAKTTRKKASAEKRSA